MPYNGARFTFHGDKFLMRIVTIEVVVLIILGSMLSLAPARAQSKDDSAQSKQASAKPEGLKPEQQASKGTVTIAGTAIPYDAFAGTVVVHPKGWDDVPQNEDKDEQESRARSQHVLRCVFQVRGSECAAAGYFFL